MSRKNKDSRIEGSKTNARLKSSIVHKPFATGTINIFNPHRSKSNKSSLTSSELSAPKLYLNAELEPDSLTVKSSAEQDETEVRGTNFSNLCLNPWSISAIAIAILANLVSGAVIWRQSRLTAQRELQPVSATLERVNLADDEFVPLNLSTLSRLKTAENIEEPAIIEPISPALAPIELSQSTSEPTYYYVLSEYTGDKSLTVAREQAKGISLVNLPEGVFIYLGAYKERDLADTFVAHLKESDLAAQIYPFN